MSKQTINIGASPNDGTGTPLRTSFDYTNQNFTELYTALGGGVGLPGATTQVIFNDGGTNLAGDAGLVYNKTTDALTVAGLVTAGSATITGAATVGTTLGVTGDSTLTGAVGVGATPIGKFDVYNTGSDTTVFIRSDTTRLGQIVFRDNADAGNQGLVRYDHANDRLSFTANGAENLFLLSNGDLSLITGNVVVSNGKGIDFSAKTPDGSGTVGSEVLNDYEEGTFVPVIIGTASAGTATYAAQIGRYTKVGRIVQFQIDVNYSAGTGTGNLQIDGLPFQNSNNLAPLSTYLISIGMTALYYAVALIGTNSTKIDINQLPTGGGSDLSIPYDGAGRIILSGTYTV